MKISEIEKIIEADVPKSLAYDWDNVGLLIGDKNKEIKKALLTLDTNLFTINEAINTGADIIISHHPLFFEPLKKIIYGTPSGEIVRLLIENNIAVYAAHTNMDTAKNGINAYLAELFGLENVKVIDSNSADNSTGLGRYGSLKNSTGFSNFIETVKTVLKTPVRYTGDVNKSIKTVAVASGACAELVPVAKALDCDVLITADMKYHQMIDAEETGMCLIDAGHYPTEICVMEIFEKLLKNTDIEIVKSKNTDIFKFSY